MIIDSTEDVNTLALVDKIRQVFLQELGVFVIPFQGNVGSDPHRLRRCQRQCLMQIIQVSISKKESNGKLTQIVHLFD
jgi:hypothetical protein